MTIPKGMWELETYITAEVPNLHKSNLEYATGINYALMPRQKQPDKSDIFSEGMVSLNPEYS